MALKKQLTMVNGITLEYHRIALVSIEPNHQITILRHSYLNEEARLHEKNYAEGKEDFIPVYVDADYIHMKYDENIDVMNGDLMKCAYELLKKHCPEFEDSEDLLE